MPSFKQLYKSIYDVPQMIRDGSYEIDVEPPRLMEHLARLGSRPQGMGPGLNLDPDFQRGHVWTEAQQIAYIEFFLRGGRTARVLYLNCPTWMRDPVAPPAYNEFVLVDGRQRIEAWRKFFSNTLRVFGAYAEQYANVDHFRTTHTLRININTLATRAEVLQWYIDFNSGGTPHSAAEITRVRKLLAEQRKLDRHWAKQEAQWRFKRASQIAKADKAKRGQ